MKILIVDDHPLVRKGLLSTLSYEENVESILEASNYDEAMKLIRTEKPELAIVDLYLGKGDGLEVVIDAKKLSTNTKFLILTSSVKKDDFFRSRDAGVDGYVLKEAFAEDILYAVHVVLRGKQYIDPEVISYQAAAGNSHGTLDELTPRECDVLLELGKGLSNLEIAQKLFISENTVKKHVSNVLSKLQLEHRTQAALMARELLNI